LNLEAGWAGLWDLGTAGLLAAGAYTFVIFTIHVEQLDAGHELIFSPEFPMWAGVIAASLFTGLLAFLIGLPSLRLRDEYFLITTFAFSVVVLQLLQTESYMTAGAVGFHDISRPFDELVTTRTYNFVLFGISLVALAAVAFLLNRLSYSPFIRALRALRDNEVAAQSVGKHIMWPRLKAFVIAGMLIGAISPLYVWFVRMLSPHLFHVTLAFTVWTAMVIGGMGNRWGPLLGAFLLIGFTESLQFLQFSAEYAVITTAARPFFIGLGLILVMRFRPVGLMPEHNSFRGIRRQFLKKK